jgi:tRNA (guanine37-N1)-methyltransferase
MKFNLFSIQPNIFKSFFETALIAKGLEKNVFKYEICNWREEFGIGKYKQVDQQAFGGGTGMVLKVGPIFSALEKQNAISRLFQQPTQTKTHQKIYPNNQTFFELNKKQKIGKVSILLSPRGFPFNQKVANWLAKDFQEISLVCGRYEGFDARVSEIVDLEISLGNFVLGGGEVAAMAMIEAITRLLPGFLVKENSKEHDSFSSGLNLYTENTEYILGKRRLLQKPSLKEELDLTTKNQTKFEEKLDFENSKNLFDNQWWEKNVLPYIEHPHYTRPEIWQNMQTPQVLLSGDHKKVQKWREGGWLKSNYGDTINN